MMNIKPLKLFLPGLVVVFTGALLRVAKLEYATVLLTIGLILEIWAGVIFFTKLCKKHAK